MDKTAAGDKTKLQGDLSVAQARVTQLQADMAKLKQDSQLTGSTPEETPEKSSNNTMILTFIPPTTCLSAETWPRKSGTCSRQ